MSATTSPYSSELAELGFTARQPPGVVYAVDRDLRLIYRNDAWNDFAHANSAPPRFMEDWGVGCATLDAVRGPLRGFYAGVFRAALTRGHRWQRIVECSSPDRYRAMRIQVVPVRGRAEALFVSESMLERPHDPESRPSGHPREQRYRDVHGRIWICGHCARTRRSGDPHVWDWVPDYIATHPPGTTYGLCPICADYFFAD